MSNQRPKKPFRSLKEAKTKYISSWAFITRKYAKDEYPCTACCAQGTVRDLKECDYYEGYKLAHWYPCKVCNKTGKTDRKTFAHWANIEMAFYRGQLTHYQERQRALKKLSHKEQKILGL
jgi:hypothetical protein